MLPQLDGRGAGSFTCGLEILEIVVIDAGEHGWAMSSPAPRLATGSLWANIFFFACMSVAPYTSLRYIHFSIQLFISTYVPHMSTILSRCTKAMWAYAMQKVSEGDTTMPEETRIPHTYQDGEFYQALLNEFLEGKSDALIKGLHKV